jgi:hypothetical protein
MTDNTNHRTGLGVWMAGGAALLLMGAWPVWSHLEWSRGEGMLHAVPAFLVGGLFWWLGLGLGWVLSGMWRGGSRWLVSGEAGRRFVALATLGLSLVVLFYAVESWRGRRAWARVEILARDRGLNLEVRSLVPPAVPADEDFGQAPMFEPLRRRFADRTSPGAAASGLGALDGLITWGQSGQPWTSEGMKAPGWMTGQSIVDPLKRASRKGMAVRMARDAAGNPKVIVRPDGSGEVRSESGPEDVAREFLTSVEPYAPLLEEARRYAGREHCRLTSEHESPFLSDNASERVLLALQRMAFARAHALVLLNQGEEALQEIELGLRLIRHGHGLPGVYLSGWRATTVAHGMQSVWEGLARKAWSEPQMARIQKALEASGEGANVAVDRQIRVTAVATLSFVESLIPTVRGPAAAASLTEEMEGERRALEWVRRFYPTGWSLQDQASVLDGWLRLLDRRLGVEAGSSGARGEVDVDRALRATSDPVYTVFVLPKVRQMLADAQVFPGFGEVCLRLAGMACAVERYRMSNGVLPESLAGLGPPLRETDVGWRGDPGAMFYRRDAGGSYVLYSAGLNGRDDGGERPGEDDAGRLGPAPERMRDWVWVGAGFVANPSSGRAQ